MGGVATPPISVAGTWVIRLTGGRRKKRRGGREELEEVMADKPNRLEVVMPNKTSWLILLV